LNGKGTVLRRNGDNGNIVLSAPDATDGIFLRPNGTGSADGQVIVNKNGNMTISGGLSVSGRGYGVNKTLWSGALYMTGAQSAVFSELVTDQPNGIILVFSRYASGAPEDSNFNLFFVPKQFVLNQSGKGSCYQMFTVNFGIACAKYLYIGNTRVDGNDLNTATGTGVNGITYDNSAYVLRYVFGV
jgi:hypothetical protein